MASAAPPSTSSGGVSSSMWASQPPSKQGWGRGGEPGGPFRGTSRGRPGRGGGRGARAGRGGGRANGPNTPRSDDKGPRLNGTQTKEGPSPPTNATPAAPSAPISANATSTTPAVKPPISQTKGAQRSRKVSEAKPPRKVPPIVIEPPATTASSSPLSATTPNRSRRKRSQNRSAPSISSSKKSPSTESSTSLLRPDKSPVITKDLPPHLAPVPPETPSFDIKHDIDALVERVRAVAMDRPNTPGSHIDWAGEDDDSLPDLDDWGVKSIPDKSTGSVTANQQDLISPILADALKPLPNIDSPLVVPAVVPSSEISLQKYAVTSSMNGDNKPRGPATVPPPPSGAVQTKEKHVEKVQPPATKDRKKSDASTKSVVSTASSADKETAPKNGPLHPSLPAKPVDAMGTLAKRVPRKAVPPVQAPDPSADVEAPLKSGLSESMHAPKINGDKPQDDPSDNSSSSAEPQGVAASIHAPVQSAPSHITTHTTQSVPSFHPTHGRAHTIGRPGAFRVPFSPSHAQFPEGHGGERSSHRDRLVNHARTHSSPPTGPGTSTAHSRTVHAARPVITVDALSRLARQLGATPAKREPASVALSKD